MTNLQALKASVNFPVEDDKCELALTDRLLVSADTYAGISQEFELAKADLLILLVSSANISEGGYAISMTDKSNMMTIANGIYAKYDVEAPTSPKAVNRSNYW